MHVRQKLKINTINTVTVNTVFAAFPQDAWELGLRPITFIDVLPFIGRSPVQEYTPYVTMICDSLLGNEVTKCRNNREKNYECKCIRVVPLQSSAV